MDRNVRKGKTWNCRTIADIMMVWTGNALFISFLILESDKKGIQPDAAVTENLFYFFALYGKIHQCERGLKSIFRNMVASLGY